MPPIKPGFVVYADADTREGIEAARAWAKEKGLTPQDVRLYRLDGMVLIETLRPVTIPPTPSFL